MCGIAGMLGLLAGAPSGVDLGVVALRMARSLSHRGPDDEGIWTDPVHGVALAHRRLSIVDLSPLGRQPMVSECGRYVLSYNGEIYNHRALRRDLAAGGVTIKGRSDTGVLLAAVATYGLVEALARVNGMFAFGLWDRETRTLHLARDRIGEKPLYVGTLGPVFAFASELKALRTLDSFTAEIDRAALRFYMRAGYIPAPHSIYRAIRKVRPGTVLSVDASGNTTETFYWSLDAVAKAGLARPLTGTPEKAVDALSELLADAVHLRMAADVPHGAFLSGGIDSSLVVALMQAQSARPVRTYSIGFAEPGYDEAGHAAAVSRHLGTDHTELYLTPQATRDVIAYLPDHFDEPFADPSAIPTYLVSKLARRDVTVALSGDGGDELFCGYERYRLGGALRKTMQRVPPLLRGPAGRALSSISATRWTELLGPLTRQLRPDSTWRRNAGEKIRSAGLALADPHPGVLYREMTSHWKAPGEIVRGGDIAGIRVPMGPAEASFAHQVMFADASCYLPDDVLTKVDRVSMAVGLEVRVPLLDHRVIEWSWRVPMAMQVRGGAGKWLLRQLLARHVPPAMFDRRKMGFGVPLDVWLRGPLRGWAEELLSPVRLADGDLLEPGPIRVKWAQHLAGTHRWEFPLWNVLMFQAWRAHVADQATARLREAS